jgi:predicted small metal-binding protein
MTVEPQTWQAGCACGWETTGSVDDVVLAVQDHARRIHNMEATREEVLARAQPLEPGAASSSGGRTDRNRTQSARS